MRLVTGDDPVLVGEAVRTEVDRLLDGGDRSLLVAEFEGDDYELREVADAAGTPPFLTDLRIVVARGANRFGADDLGPLLAYLADPLPTTALVVAWGSGRVPKKLTDALKAAGGQRVDAGTPRSGKARTGWLAERFRGSGLDLTSAAQRAIGDHLGEDVSRLAGLLRTLTSTYGTGVKLDVADVEPYLGDAGSVAPWDLTDAIDAGRVRDALDLLHRMLGAGDRHPLQILATLHRRYEQLLRLDGAAVRTDKEAADVLGLNSTYPAKKARTTASRIGSDGIRRAITLLADADLDLKGRRAYPGDVDGPLVLEILVARLARLART